MDSMGGLLTKGLGGPATCTLVDGFLRLKIICAYTPTNQNTAIYDGESRPYAPGEIANLYKPVAPHLQPINESVLPFMRPYHPPVPLQKVTIKVMFKRDKEPAMGESVDDNDGVYTREFMVPQSRAKMIVSAFNIVNTTAQKIQVTVDKLRYVATRIKVIVTSFRKK